MGMTYGNKEDYVIFSSRFDDEKDPMFFLDLVERCPDIQFRLVNPRSTIKITANAEVQSRLEALLSREGGNLRLIDTREKVRYYEALQRAKVQFNCAHQDWVSWTLLEAVTFGCLPLYPIWKDFPSELRDNPKYLYKKRDLDECEKKLRVLMSSEQTDENDYIVEKHDKSWEGYLKAMGIL